jgi:CheY-like chemotaxis protein
MDGREFLRRWQLEPPCAPAPVVIMSAARDASTIADQLRVDAFLPKPFELDDMLAVIKRVARA